MANHVYVECKECVHLGQPTCRKPNEKWSPSVVRGCMVEESEAKLLKQGPIPADKVSKDGKQKPYIAFSHRYVKLHGQKTAELLAIRPITIDSKTSLDLLDYDTLYFCWIGGYARDPATERCHFNLSPGDYMQLIFLGDKGIPFCSIRKQGDYWHGDVGDIF